MEMEYFWGISRGVFQILWLILYWYYLEQTGTMEKGAGKRALGFCIAAGSLLLGIWLPLWTAWLPAVGVILLYDLFFDAEPFRRQWGRIFLPGICLIAGACLPERTVFLFHGLILYIFLLLLLIRRESLRGGNTIMTAVSFLPVSAFLWAAGNTRLLAAEDGVRGVLLWGGALLEVSLFFLVEGTLYFYKKGFEYRTERFRSELMEHSYGEIRNIYMDMRGWRHDYHNHMQVMKARLDMGDMEGLGKYLEELEQELDRVDTLVKSGNLMADAILNSKLTLARRHGISINCKAKLPERLPVEDVDLCVILGNLLDNAIEACGQMEEGGRFLRIYMTVNKTQFYLSVQNSAKEDPDFDQRNYISRKRGNHGLGMKRVKAAVDKYQGYLKLANEPGIFAAEATMPLGQM